MHSKKSCFERAQWFLVQTVTFLGAKDHALSTKRLVAQALTVLHAKDHVLSAQNDLLHAF